MPIDTLLATIGCDYVADPSYIGSAGFRILLMNCIIIILYILYQQQLCNQRIFFPLDVEMNNKCILHFYMNSWAMDLHT